AVADPPSAPRGGRSPAIEAQGQASSAPPATAGACPQREESSDGFARRSGGDAWTFLSHGCRLERRERAHQIGNAVPLVRIHETAPQTRIRDHERLLPNRQPHYTEHRLTQQALP